MNPLAYLFESLSSLSDETQLLEACDWDEDRLEYIKEVFNNTLNEILLEESAITDSADLTKLLSEKLRDTIEEKELGTCLHIIERNLKNFLESNAEVDYEN